MKKIVFLLVLILSIQGLFAQKVLNPYGGFTGTDIKNRASVPLQANIAVNGTAVECRNITITNIRTILDETLTGIGALSTSPKVNPFSEFGPREWYINAGVLTDRIKTPYQFGNFACYDHNAVAPYISSMPTNLYIIEGQTELYLPIAVLLGQIDWKKHPFLKSVNLEVLINGSSAGVQHLELGSDYLKTTHSFNLAINTTGWTYQHTATFRFYFGKDAANSWTELANVPNITNVDAVINVWLKAKLGTFNIGSDLQTSLGGNATIIKTPANCYITQNDAGADMLTLSTNGIDTNSDGVGDLNLVQADRYIWVQLNGGDWYIQDAIRMHVDDSAGGTYTLPWNITYNDVVNVEIR